MIDELHPISKTPLYVVYPTLRPLRKMLSCLPWMNYEEVTANNSEHEMRDLLSGQEVQKTVTIGGKQVIKRHNSKIKQHINAKAAE